MILVIIFLIAYNVLLLLFHVGWHRAVRDRANTSVPFYPMISVVVPVRNERENISFLLNDLRQQEYGNYEVIVVDDHSTDDSVQVAESTRFANVTIVRSQETGKKAALQSGIAVAKGEIIATTDADCRLGKHWLECIQKSFVNQNVKFGFGAVSILPDESFFSKLQAIEFSSLIGSGAASSALGFPTMCNGANLAFRREAFYEVNGYKGNEHIPSGDDEFLMRKMENRFHGGVKFISYKDATVMTNPLKTVRAFVNQRMRWAGKWRHNTSIGTIMLALFVFAMQFAVIAAIILIAMSLNYAIVILLLAKLLLEGSFINRVVRFSKIRMSWTALLFLQAFYPLYVIGIGIFSNFYTPVWKDRKVSSRSHASGTG